MLSSNEWWDPSIITDENPESMHDLAQFKGVSVVQVKHNGDGGTYGPGHLKCSVHHVGQEIRMYVVPRVLPETCKMTGERDSTHPTMIA